MNLHAGDVAHTLLLGATGAGKSFTLRSTLQALQKYGPLTFIFDVGGSYLNVGLKTPGFSINPLSLEPTHENLNFLYLLIEGQSKYTLTGDDEKALFAGIQRAYKPRAIY